MPPPMWEVAGPPTPRGAARDAGGGTLPKAGVVGAVPVPCQACGIGVAGGGPMAGTTGATGAGPAGGVTTGATGASPALFGLGGGGLFPPAAAAVGGKSKRLAATAKASITQRMAIVKQRRLGSEISIR